MWYACVERAYHIFLGKHFPFQGKYDILILYVNVTGGRYDYFRH